MASKINFVVRLQHWMDSVPGQTFLNYAYSWGAAIVILGALFKLTHLQGGDVMLFIGMGTEVIVFFLSAFDRPFDKNEIGKELPADYETDEEIAASMEEDDEEETEEGESEIDNNESISRPATINTPAASGHIVAGTQGGGSTVIIGGGSGGNMGNAAPAVAATNAGTSTGIAGISGLEFGPQDTEAEKLAAIIRLANDELLRRAQAVLSPEMEAATQTYIEKLQTLTETLAKVDEQSARLTRDSEEMENLNRTLTGINRIYELQLKGVSSQVGTIDQINEQTRRLAAQIEELNGVYGRMIKALTVNMKNAGAAISE
ncbi:MAG: gliding motility protein GldL [Bacteroidaceae bacterium]|nr:gliding motility protein GldL [Bacteroidaceae bacterium]